MEDCDWRRRRRRWPSPGRRAGRRPLNSNDSRRGFKRGPLQVSPRPTPRQPLKPVILLRLVAILLIATSCLIATISLQQQQPQPQTAQQSPSEYQLLSHAGGVARLPCLIGKQSNCGEPYFIAWYKLNSTSRQWTRIETSRSDRLEEGGGSPSNALPAAPNRAPLAERVQFAWSGGRDSDKTGPPLTTCLLGTSDENGAGNSTLLLNAGRLPAAQQSLVAAFRQFDCAQLTIRPLELQDEGQYKCDITFSEAIEFDRCPASTLTQLNVIARPNEPEILLNGRQASLVVATETETATAVATATGAGDNQQRTGNGLTFKEGAQVRLECQSSGGKPAPRIEWLNLTTWTGTGAGGGPWWWSSSSGLNLAESSSLVGGAVPTWSNSMKLNDDQSMDSAAAAAEIQQRQAAGARTVELAQLMRLRWPIKRATYPVGSHESQPLGGGPGQQQPAASGNSNNNINQIAQNQQQQLIPVTSSAITITLSRFDLRSRFACLVLPQTSAAAALNSISGPAGGAPTSTNNNNNNQPASPTNELKLLAELPAGLRNAHALNQAANQVSMLNTTRLQAPDGPMLSWIQLGVLAKPTSVSIRILELDERGAAKPVKAQQQQQQPGPTRQPFYSLQPNRLYAIQCLVENSRPRSQVAWFNRTAPLELLEPTRELTTADYIVPSPSPSPAARHNHRLSSFVRHIESEWGTFSTVSSLLLTTNFHDNFQELFCRVSNEAFQFDELVQVAPIISARIYVNYPPSAWLEAPDVDWTAHSADEQLPAGGHSNKLGRLSVESGGRLQLRCLVGASPLLQNAIVQIDWLKDGRRLAATSNTTTTTTTTASSSRLQIEKAYNLHMPLAGSHQHNHQQQQQQPPLDLSRAESRAGPEVAPASNARLLTFSTLTLVDIGKPDAGLYSCQFKLIPAPTSSPLLAAGPQQVAASNVSLGGSQYFVQQQQPARIISGQSGQAIQLTVIEAKMPVVRVSSASGLLVYDRMSPPPTASSSRHHHLNHPSRSHERDQDHHHHHHHHQRHQLEVVVAQSNIELRLKCDFANSQQQGPRADLPPAASLGRRVLWYLSGAYVHSSSSDLLVLWRRQAQTGGDEPSAAAQAMQLRLATGNGGRISCAHQTFQPGGPLAAASAGTFNTQSMKLFPSSNELDLRFNVEPRLLQADRREPLMPAMRSFSELELAAQPTNRLRLACLAQCEPVCSIEWLLNGQPLVPPPNDGDESLSPPTGDSPTLDNEFSQPVAQVQEIADNQTRVFRSARQLEWTPVVATAGSSNSLSFVQLDNLIHRKTLSSSERFPWYRQTALVAPFAGGPATLGQPREVGAQTEAASRQLMRDAYELAAASQASNVFGKLELAYNQIGQLLLAASAQAGGASQNNELLFECRPSATFGGRSAAQFGSAHVAPHSLHPRAVGNNEQPPSESPLSFDQLELSSLFASSSSSSDGTTGRQRERPVSEPTPPQQPRNAFQTRVFLERSPDVVDARPTPATLAPPVDGPADQQQRINHHQLDGRQDGRPSLSLEAQLSSLANASQTPNSNHLLDGQFAINNSRVSTAIRPNISPGLRTWLVNNHERILVGATVLALVWLLSLCVVPIAKQRLALGGSKMGGTASLAMARDLHHHHHHHHHNNNKSATSKWRFNNSSSNNNSSSKQHRPISRASSTNEIGITANGSSSSSSSMMTQHHHLQHKFGLLEPQPASAASAFGYGISAATPNYYGAPDSSVGAGNGGESLERDMAQSCSQSSNYEDSFIQQQQQPRIHQQPLYFNQTQLVEAATLSRRPLVQYSAIGIALEAQGALQSSARARQAASQCQRQQQASSTLRHHLSNVPLISGLNSGTSSRIDFNDLQRHSRGGAPLTHNNDNKYSIETNRHPHNYNQQQQQQHYSFSQIPLQPSIIGASASGQPVQQRAQHPDQHPEHIYDDVS